MDKTVSQIRRWWQAPRRVGDIDRDRRVSFLELFYDLVYVVLIAELAHALAGHISSAGVLNFAFLFTFVWWAWINGRINGTMYYDLHGNNDLRTRVFTFMQMLTVASMAVFAHNALGDGSVGFALSFVAYQLILTYLSWRTGVHDPAHRPLSDYNSLILLIAAALVFVSVFVPPPARFVLWVAALVISLLLPLFLNAWRAQDQQFHNQVKRVWSLSQSAVERFGLLTIIVLGEVVVGAVQGVAGHHHIDLEVGLTASLGILIAIGMWSLYFDFVSHRLPRSGEQFGQGWMYFHLPMTMGIAATGAAVLNVVVLVGESISGDVRWLLVGAPALTIAAIAVLMRMIHIAEKFRTMYRTGEFMILASAAAILLLLILLMLTPVFYGIKVLIVEFGAEEIETD
jgi:low temperature requirement protein LtrA